MKKFTLILISLSFLLFNILVCNAQNKKKKADDSYKLLKPLTTYDSIGLINLPKLTLPDGYNGKYVPLLPSTIDNSINQYWRPVYAQVGLECGQASGIGLGFTYGINRERNLSSAVEANQYTPHFTWNFTNGGNGWYGVSYFHSFEIVKMLGNPNVVTYGGMFSPSPYNMWMNGYDHYYQAMHNRISDVYQIDVSTEEGILTAKHWLHNHLDNSSIGGVANFYANSPSASNTLPAGTPEAGKYVVKSWGGANHAMTISGYHDEICWDYNSDGQYTNDIDINSDGVINVRDWEVGGFRFANTYSGGPNWGNEGFSYMTYKSCADPSENGGIWNNSIHVIFAKEDCSPQLTAKITLKHSCRDQIRVRMGVSTDIASEIPDYIIGFPIFDFHGGCQYMQGGTSIEANKTIEFGLDLTPLLNIIGSNVPARYFLLVDENDPNNSNIGEIIQYSIIDYTSGMNEIACAQSNVPMNNNSLTKVWVNHTVSFNKPVIDTNVLPDAPIYEQYSHPLSASGGQAPYYWDLDLNFDESNSSGAYPTINAVNLTPSDNDDGFTIQSLDFSFPFYDSEFNEVKVFVDGHIMFENVFSWPYDVYDFFTFTKNKYIAPFMADLQIYPADGDGIWYEGDANSATFRWKVAVNSDASTELNFAVKLFSNGNIKFYYGALNSYSNLDWKSGLSAGDNLYYQFTEVSNDPTIPINQICDLTASKRPEEFNVRHDGIVEGLPENVYTNLGFKVRATDENNITTSKEVFITTGGSFLKVDTIIISSGGDDIIEYGETTYLTVGIKCLGDEPVTQASMELFIDNVYITILDNTQYLGNFSAGQLKTFTNAFSFDIGSSIPNNTALDFQIIIDDNSGNEWINNRQLMAYAPILNIGNISTNDGGDNIIDPGETADIIIDLLNSGGATAYNLNSTLSSNDPKVTINTNSSYLASLSQFGFGANATFNITVASDLLIGDVLDFTIEILADLGIASTHNFSISIGQPPILIIDLDPNHSSAPSMEASFSSLGVHYEKVTTMPSDVSTYSGIFVCLGIYSYNHSLQTNEGLQLADYLNNGGCLYMEGGDTWAFDSQTAVHSMFNINGVVDGTGDMGTVLGQTGTFTEGMSFTYNGENSWMDHIEPIGDAILIFENQLPVYGTAVAYDGLTYKTIGASHEYAGLSEGTFPSTKEELMRLYLEFFNLLPAPIKSLDLKVFLEGPFNGIEMTTELNTKNLLPLQQPFKQYPWFYNGVENVSSMPNDIVDWLLIELRDTTSALYATSESIIVRKAVFLHKDGSIVGLDGISEIQFDNIILNQLFVAIWQRNHLGVLSANPLNGFNNIYNYDFTSSESEVLGGNLAHKEIAPGIWGLVSGDGNCDGEINSIDLYSVWSIQAGQSVYDFGDFNMDGNIDNKDKDDIYINNEGYDSYVPD